MGVVIAAIIAALVGLLVGAAAVYFTRKRSDGTAVLQAEEQANRVLAEAEQRQKELLLEAKEEDLKLRNTLETEMRERRAEVTRIEQRLTQREENLDRKGDGL